MVAVGGFGQGDAVQAVVAVSDIPFTDEEGKYDLDQVAPIFTDYMILHRYEKDGHRYMMGIASPGGFQGNKAAFVQLASPTLLWICDFTAARLNQCPVIPDPLEVSGDWVLLDEHYEPAMLALGPDGVTPLYRLSGTYVYGHRNPDELTVNDLSFPRPPWMQEVFDRTVPDTVLASSLSEVRG